MAASLGLDQWSGSGTAPVGAGPHAARVVVPVVAGAWVVIVAADLSGSPLLSHDALFAGGTVEAVDVGVFLLGWQLMVVAMMLPASYPALRAVGPRAVDLGAFLAGFAAVWTGFAVAALGLDAVVHRVVDLLPWLDERSYLLGVGALTVAGLWEFSSMKRRCLAACRTWRPSRRGAPARGALADGLDYGRLCLVCDSGLMVLMLATGGSAPWMGMLALTMVIQRSNWLRGDAPRVTGAAALALGAALVVGGAL